MNNGIKGVKEDLSLAVVERLFEGRNKVRVVIGPHPVHGKASSFVPYSDLADALTCPQQTIYSIISRSERVKRYTGFFMMKTPGGIQSVLCLAEEGVLHAAMKLQPSRCSDPKVADRLDEVQDEMIQLLRDALHGYADKSDGNYLAKAKVICSLVSVMNSTKDHLYRNLLHEQLEILSGEKIVDRQLTLLK